MSYFFVLIGGLFATWIIIGIAGAIYDAKNRAIWRQIARECGVWHG